MWILPHALYPYPKAQTFCSWQALLWRSGCWEQLSKYPTKWTFTFWASKRRELTRQLMAKTKWEADLLLQCTLSQPKEPFWRLLFNHDEALMVHDAYCSTTQGPFWSSFIVRQLFVSKRMADCLWRSVTACGWEEQALHFFLYSSCHLYLLLGLLF